MTLRLNKRLLALAAACAFVTPANATIISSIDREFDILGRLQKESRPDGGWVSYAYDPNGNRTEARDNLGRVTTYTYDALNRVSSITDPERGVTRLGYDAASNITSVTDPRGLVTTYVRDGMGNVLQVTSPDSGVTKYTRRPGGQILTKTDAKGQVTRFDYTPTGRLTKITFADNKEQTFAYGPNGAPGAGLVTEVTDASGKIAYTYEILDRITSEKRTIWNKEYTTGYGYDTAGRLGTVTYPSGRVVTFSYDAAGQVSKISTKQGTGEEKVVVQNLTYRPFGQITGWTYGNGEVRTSSYDNLNRMTSYSMGDSTVTLSYDTANRITSQKVSGGWWERMLQRLGLPVGLRHSYDYDNLNRLSSWRNGVTVTRNGFLAMPDTGFSYDENGNRKQIRDDDAVFIQDIDAKSNRLTAASIPGGNSPVFQYDANGSRTSGSGSYTYDARGRLIEASGAQYTVNANSERVAKTFQGTTTVFHYNQWGQLIAESDQLGVTKREYIYLGDTPIALVDNGLDVRNIHPDHLGTPRLITDATKHAIWSWQLGEPFGASAAEEDPEGTGGKYAFNLRFPGQYFDKETSTHYNYFRNYDPKNGRYLESDPIGLEGGINTFVYVGGNPLSFSDPLGLEKMILLKPGDANYPAAVAAPDIPGILTVHSHGNPDRVSGLDARQLADLIRNSGKWKDKMPVTLDACRTGEGDKNIAKNLSQELDTKVTAPDSRTLTAGEWDLGPWHSMKIPFTGRGVPYFPGKWKTYYPSSEW
ncbi:RHS repeat domain-containing protein [Chitinimonas sp. PSY-7]|uniref:RHS repeat-associated core domain-containing protein n=1 Tax=Chitinimonas sp. PSY-7 TaxID=3459088 RepID=UPI00403FFC1C